MWTTKSRISSGSFSYYEIIRELPVAFCDIFE
jgi:hypothetical protein